MAENGLSAAGEIACLALGLAVLALPSAASAAVPIPVGAGLADAGTTLSYVAP